MTAIAKRSAWTVLSVNTCINAWSDFTHLYLYYSHPVSTVTLALTLKRNTLISVTPFTRNISISIKTSRDASVKIQMGNGPIQNINASVYAAAQFQLSVCESVVTDGWKKKSQAKWNPVFWSECARIRNLTEKPFNLVVPTKSKLLNILLLHLFQNEQNQQVFSILQYKR